MKPIAHVLRLSALVSLIIGMGAVLAEAGTWRDTFQTPKKGDWELWGEDSAWKVQDGFLRTEIQTQDTARYELLQFKALPGPYGHFKTTFNNRIINRWVNMPGYEDFIITVEDLGSEAASFGIALGKLFPEVRPDKPFFYLFFTKVIEARMFDGGGGILPFRRRIPRHPGTFWDTRALNKMEIRFHAGHFLMYANGELRADFHDPGFSPIEIIGFVIVGSENAVGTAWADAFTISGPALDVSPNAKLATTWGILKKRRK